MVPKLVDYDWRVDIKTDSNLSNSDDSAKSGQQTCILQLKVIHTHTQLSFILTLLPTHSHSQTYSNNLIIKK